MRRLLLLLLLLLLFIAACDEASAKNDLGFDALLQITSSPTQFYRGAMPLEENAEATTPKIINATVSGKVTAGAVNLAGTGEGEPATLAIAVGMVGDAGYWIVRARTPGAAAPINPTFQFVFSVAKTTPVGMHDVILRAVDQNGRFGPAIVRKLDVGAPIRPTGNLVVSLTWDTPADLDLHVVLPSGLEIFKRNRTEYQRPPISAGPVDPNAPIDGGVLDRDSNAACVQDGQRAEDVVWKEPPPKGHYVVRVDTFSLCGAASAPWKLDVLLDGNRIGSASGTGTENDLRFEHNRGGGVLAVEFDVP